MPQSRTSSRSAVETQLAHREGDASSTRLRRTMSGEYIAHRRCAVNQRGKRDRASSARGWSSVSRRPNDAVLSIARGEFRCSPRVAALLAKRVSALSQRLTPDQRHGHLTPRERAIVPLIDEGLSNKGIAARLGIEISTVKNHVHHILEKLHALRRTRAAAQFRRGRLTRRLAGTPGWIWILRSRRPHCTPLHKRRLSGRVSALTPAASESGSVPDLHLF